MRRGEGEEGGLGYHTSHSESLEVTERMEVPVSARSVRLDTLVVGLAAVDGDSAEPCVGQPGSASERMPLGPMAWCWSLRETESGARPDTVAAPRGSSRPPPRARACGACPPPVLPFCPFRHRSSPAPPLTPCSALCAHLFLQASGCSLSTPEPPQRGSWLLSPLLGAPSSFPSLPRSGPPSEEKQNPRPAAWGVWGHAGEDDES